MLKRIIVLVLAVAMVLSLGIPAMADDNPSKLTSATHEKYINGMGNGKFSPEGTLTRAQVCQMLFNLLVETSGKETKSFSDVNKNNWFYAAVTELAADGLLMGYPDGSFMPDNPIGRAEYIAILCRFYELEPGNTGFATDISGHWSIKYLASAYAKGWIEADENGHFRPNEPITRADAVVILNRVLGRVPDKAAIDALDSSFGFTDVPKTDSAYYDIMEAATTHTYTVSGGTAKWIKGSEGFTSGSAELDKQLWDLMAKAADQSTMTREQMLKSAYTYVVNNFRYIGYSAHYTDADKGWEKASAELMLKNNGGNCYCFAAVFGYLAQMLGYDAVPHAGTIKMTKSDGTQDSRDHAFVMIDKLIYDTMYDFSNKASWNEIRLFGVENGLTVDEQVWEYIF
ncbi:MAG: S-layer homology domain-containing protein [Oscillospiraceae bacterium]|nr:S-layer homology domain-containing protein [Oscillospiraceae bacterium]